MKIGLPKERKENEYRVAIIPSNVGRLVDAGHDVYVEHDAGKAAGFSDEMYLEKGARILSSEEEVFKTCELIIKVKEILPSEFGLLNDKHILFTYIHSANRRPQTEELLNSKCVAFAYLRKRGIAAQVIRQFMNSGLLYEDAEHHNCVFVGKNSAGQAKYAGLRGTYDRDGKGFRGDVTGSDKNVGFAIPHDPTSDQVRVFEAPIDLMSYLTLHREPINAVALCGLYDGALETYLKDNPHIKRITLCLDSDAPGRAAAQQLKDKYSARGYAVTVEEPRSGKDWNEYLQKRNTPERGR